MNFKIIFYDRSSLGETGENAMPISVGHGKNIVINNGFWMLFNDTLYYCVIDSVAALSEEIEFCINASPALDKTIPAQFALASDGAFSERVEQYSYYH